MLDRIEFMLGEAFVALRRNSWMTFSAVSTCAVALFLLGALSIAYSGLRQQAEGLAGRFEMRVFLRDGLKKAEVSATAEKVRKIPGVKAALLIPKDGAWQRMKQSMPEITAGLENPLPDGFKVTLDQVSDARDVAAEISRLPEVAQNGVTYLDEEQQLLSDAMALLRLLGLTLGSLLFITAGVLIFNAIRLTIVARRREVRIMQLVGATRLTVITPMLIEGIVQGVLGGVIATGLLWVAFLGVGKLIESVSGLAKLGEFPATPVLLWLAIAGAAYGLLCSWLAVGELRT